MAMARKTIIIKSPEIQDFFNLFFYVNLKLMFQGFNRKKLVIFALWLILGAFLMAKYYPILIKSNLGSILGFLLFSVFFTPLIVLILNFFRTRLEIKNQKIVIIVLAVLAVFFFIFYGFFVLLKHNYFFTGYDLAIFDQALWKMSHFQIPSSSIRNVPIVFGDHFYPLISCLTPFYWIWSDPRALLVLQVLILALGIIPLYLICRELKIRNLFIGFLALFYLISPAIFATAILDFHEIVFAPILILGLFYFLLRKNWFFYFLFLFLLVLVKENLTLFIVFFGIFLLFERKLFKIAISTILFGIVSFFVITYLIIPWLSGSSYAYFGMFAGFEEGFFKGILNMFTEPEIFLRAVFGSFDKWWVSTFYVLMILPAFIFLPQGILLFLPLALEKVLSLHSAVWFMGYHYNLVFLPIQIIVLILALKKISPDSTPKNLKNYFSFGLIIFSLIFTFAYNYQFSFFFSPRDYSKEIRQAPKKEFEELLLMIPDGAPVSASQIFLPHLSHRQNLYLIPRTSDAEFIIFHRTCVDFPSISETICNFWPLPEGQIRIFENYLRNHPAFKILKETPNAIIFERIIPQNPELKKELSEFCAELIKASNLKYMHYKYMLKNCYE